MNIAKDSALFNQSSDFLEMNLIHSLWQLWTSPLFIVLPKFESEMYFICLALKAFK